jgi:hypothetical protein
MDLWQRASGKGLFCGGLVIHLKQGGSVVGNDATGSLIPDSADILRFEAPADLAWVLIVEKEVSKSSCNLWRNAKVRSHRLYLGHYAVSSCYQKRVLWAPAYSSRSFS